MEQLGTFTSEDVKQHKLLSDLISKNVEKWSLSTADVVQLYRSLVWLAQLSGKLEKHIFEVTAVKQMEPKPRVPGKKATREAAVAASEASS